MSRDVALDCHRKSCFMVAVDENGEEVIRQRFETTAAGEQSLLDHITPGDRVVMEATTGVFRLANRLEAAGAEVIVVDPQHSRLVGLRGKKTDYRDCRALLQHLRAGTYVEVWRPDAQTREVRRMTRERHAHNQGIVRTKNRIRALLWEEGIPAHEDLWSPAGQEWISQQALSPCATRIIRREQFALQVLERLKGDLDVELSQMALETPEAERLMQIAGFGPVLAVMFLGEVGRIHRFSTSKQLVSYAGLDPRAHQSGERCQGGRVSKAGRSQLRWIMTEVAWSQVRLNGPQASTYHHLLGRGKTKGVAITALARKLLVIAYQMLRSGENYHPLNAAQYEMKLQRLAGHRPFTEEAQPTNVDWAAGRLKQVTGCDSPYLVANPRTQVHRRARPPGTRSSASGAG